MEQHKGLDLEKYTMEELVNLVTAFKQGETSLITEPSEIVSAVENAKGEE